PGAASEPNPPTEEPDVAPDVVLSWTSGKFAPAFNGHTLYLSDNLDDVENSVGGTVLSTSSYTPPEPLDFGKTYYWRVDEVNAPPDSTVFEGDIWQFTVEALALDIPGDAIIADASSSMFPTEGPENTVNGSGLDADDLHSTNSNEMWLSSILDPNEAWIRYEFDKVYNLHQMLVWNHNTVAELGIGYGIKEAKIEYSVDGTDWITLGTTHEFNQATGLPGYAANTTVDLAGAAAKYVRITPVSNWGGILAQYGLGEVRFSTIPLSARKPSPESGALDVSVNAILEWRAGREAVMHDVYLSTDEQAVIDANVPTATVADTSFIVPPLDLNTMYYWRIDELDGAVPPAKWQGEVWDFATQEYLIVDDFESYNDIEAGQEGSNLIYETWVDGYENAANGSTIGYTVPFEPTMETSIVYDGEQSVPLFYDNTVAASSEITANVADLMAGQDWTGHGIKALTLRFHGDPNNSVTDQIYVKINGAKVAYEGDLDNLARSGWQMWYIDLASSGASLTNVTTLSIGFERVGAMGGQGVIYLDAIRLYPHDRQLITPAEPDTTGLQAHYEFEGNTNDSSGNARHGTPMGNPAFGAGKIGQAIQLFAADYVAITGYKGVLGASAVTVTAWINTTSVETGTIVGWGPIVDGQRFGFRVNDARIRMEVSGGNVQGDTNVNDGQWHHVAVTVQENATISYPDVVLYVDGMDDTRATVDTQALNLTAAEDVRIGSRPAGDDRFFLGLIDNVRIYDRALTPGEIAWLAGRTKAFDKPF
ncbi:MAG: discoidin domain-containing protein, partial [Phycisphaerales bacterium]